MKLNFFDYPLIEDSFNSFPFFSLIERIPSVVMSFGLPGV